MSGPLLDNVDRTKFVVFARGDFYPVTNMFDYHGQPTTDPARAFSAVAYAGPQEWLAAPVSPGEIELRESAEARLKTKLRRIE